MTEIWFVPHDETSIESIFEAMKQCQSLHPDPERKHRRWKEYTATFTIFFLPPEFSEEEEDDDYRMAEEPNEDEANIENLHIDGENKQ